VQKSQQNNHDHDKMERILHEQTFKFYQECQTAFANKNQRHIIEKMVNG